MPKRLFLLCPQQYKLPLSIVAHVCADPELILVALVPFGKCTSVGLLAFVVELSPSCPTLFIPQQTAEPLSKIAHACSLPRERSVATLPSGNMVSDAGAYAVGLLSPFPSCPTLSLPQHIIPPSSMRIHVWLTPASTLIGVRSAGVCIITGEY